MVRGSTQRAAKGTGGRIKVVERAASNAVFDLGAKDDSAGLGLIVTELVINPLKHAFPRHRAGKIVVRYESHGRNWTLSVSDNGIGIRAN